MDLLKAPRTQVPDPDDAPLLSVGDVVGDRFRIDAVLGEGGMAVVYRAEHLHLRKLVALKVLLPEFSSNPEIVARFEREAVAAGRLDSPHVVAVTDFGRLPDASFFLVMEYVKGRTLRTVLKDGAIDPRRALRILAGIVAAVGDAHQMGIVHRDLKPENIMLVDRDGDSNFVKVLDFGIAKIDASGCEGAGGSDTALTRLGVLMGTPDYMSPEQALGQPVDLRSDLYSMGVILFEMLTGERPFKGGAVAVLNQHLMAEPPDLPPAVRQRVDPQVVGVLRRLLGKLPRERFGSAAELMQALNASAEVKAQAPPGRTSIALEARMHSAMADVQRVGSTVLAWGLKGPLGRNSLPGRTISAARTILRQMPRKRIVGISVAVLFVILLALVGLTSATSTTSLDVFH
jgi:serine/threonine-protein kinase